ncbi:tyrosine-protein phosphatase [Pseudoneobacillus sp. C159]
MIDLHCHILPNVDDGPDRLAESVEMAKQAVREGITTIIATPHHRNENYENHYQTIFRKVEELNAALKAENIDLTVLPGQEPRIFGEMIDGLLNGEVGIINQHGERKYVLVELPSGHVPRYTGQLLFDMQLKGYLPIIVHPERNSEIIENPEVLYQLVKKGALTQVTASSVSGHFGKTIKKFSLQLIEANLAHFIASDAHNTTSRGFKMIEALDVVQKKFGEDYVNLFTENARLAVEGKRVRKEAPERVKRKRVLGLF